MSTKTKNTKTSPEKLAEVAQQAGLLLMTAAFTFGLVEMPENSGTKIVVPSQPAFAVAHTGGENHSDNNLRTVREETGPHYTSYSVAQRTPGRTGKV